MGTSWDAEEEADGWEVFKLDNDKPGLEFLVTINVAVYPCFRDKIDFSRTERKSLREQIKQQERSLRDEEEKFRALKREVDKMVILMLDPEGEAVTETETHGSVGEEEIDSREDTESEGSGTDQSDTDDGVDESEHRINRLQVSPSGMYVSIQITSRTPTSVEKGENTNSTKLNNRVF
ncbi:hypothetical protein QAD02_014043 [Eretmocerus hayati]|uniref:Uncharacterized protein n=1 Tax=Eretmocerus hayati TaxID=131215 RepID=A0ACC2P5F8_9HYME|nr:hypothetical protein QAD02_014043 [Eretmocerus hayati]